MKNPAQFLVELSFQEVFQAEKGYRGVQRADKPQAHVFEKAAKAGYEHGRAEHRHDNQRRAYNAPFEPSDNRREQDYGYSCDYGGGPDILEGPFKIARRYVKKEGREPEEKHVVQDKKAEGLGIENRLENRKPYKAKARAYDY